MIAARLLFRSGSCSSRRSLAAAISATAPSNAAWFACDGCRNPLIFRTNCNAAARTSSGVVNSPGFRSTLMLLHITSSYRVAQPVMAASRQSCRLSSPGNALHSPTETMKPIQRVAVLGAGTMGSRIAAHFANAGIPSLLLDIVLPNQPKRNAAALAGIDSAMKQKPGGFFTPHTASLVTPGNFEANLGDLNECD